MIAVLSMKKNQMPLSQRRKGKTIHRDWLVLERVRRSGTSWHLIRVSLSAPSYVTLSSQADMDKDGHGLCPFCILEIRLLAME